MKELISQTLSNGNTFTYQIVNGTAYNESTNNKIVSILEQARQTGQKLKVYYGDVLTGKDWNEEHDTIGTIGRSTGNIKIPLLITSSRSIGGGGLLDDCIVKIVDFKTKSVLFVNPLYVAPVVEIVPSDMEEYKYNTIVNGQLYGRHKSLKSAQICKSKLS